MSMTQTNLQNTSPKSISMNVFKQAFILFFTHSMISIFVLCLSIFKLPIWFTRGQYENKTTNIVDPNIYPQK